MSPTSPTTLTHSVITDHTQPTVPFLDWVQRQGYRVELTTEGLWIVATLIGTQEFWSGRGECGVSQFKGHGKSRQEAVETLAQNCSGKKHHPEAREGRWFWNHRGPEHQFPTFTAP